MYLRNQSGIITEIKDTDVETFFKKGFVLASESEIQEYIDEITSPNNGIQLITTPIKEDGYGQASAYLAREFRRYKVPITRKAKDSENAFIFTVPTVAKRTTAKNKIMYTMFESTTIPLSWLPHFEGVDQIVVPTTFCQKAFATRGIESIVIPLGYNYDVYNALDRQRTDEPFTFLHYDAFNYRKGFDLVIAGFRKAFGKDMKVKLIMKTVREFLPIPLPKQEYPNVEVIKGRYPTSKMLELLRQSDCFVFPSRGEGMGLTPLEALATGIPAIITVGSGMADYYNDKYFIGLKDIKEVPAVYNVYKGEQVGNMVEASIDEIAEKMIWAYENKETVKQMGIKGSKWVRDNWGVDRTVKEFLPILDRIYGKY